MVDKVNVKIVSTMLNEVRSILADTIEPESFQINQFHNKDLSQHQLKWPDQFFAYVWMFPHIMDYLWNILQEILFLNFFPNISIEEKFYSDKKCKFLSKALKNIEPFLENEWLQWHYLIFRNCSA